MNINEKITILVNSCDKYSSCWDPFFKLLKTYWPSCNCQIILNTETKRFDGYELNILSFNKQKKNLNYGERIKANIKLIKTPYTLMLMDDFFIRENVNVNEIIRIIGYLEDHKEIVCFNFDDYGDQYDVYDSTFKNFKLRSQFGKYRYNMQAGIWRTESLYKAWKDKETPWQWEVYGNVRSWYTNGKIYSIINYENSPIKYKEKHNRVSWGIYRGKWVVDDVDKLFKENNINVDYSLLGVYDQNKINYVMDKKNTRIKQLYSYGIINFIKYAYFGIIKKVKHKNVSYSEFLNCRYYHNKI